MDKRQFWQDRAKGIGISLVVFGHVLRGLVHSGMLTNTALVATLDYTIYTFHMPLFFLLAGLNVEGSLRRGRRGFLSDKLLTIVYPYFLWSLLQTGLKITIPENVNLPNTAGDLLAILFEPPAQFWFLYVLMLCHVVLALVPRSGLMLMLMFALAGAAMSGVFPYVLQKLLFNFPFYLAGVIFSRKIADWFPNGWVGLLQIVILACLFGLCAVLKAAAFGLDFEEIAVFPAACAGIAIVICCAKLMDGKNGRWAAALGTMSMTIYILHITAGAATRVMLVKLFGITEPAIHLILGVMAGLLIPICAHMVLRKFGLLPWLGLAAFPRGSKASDLRPSQAPELGEVAPRV